jgi:hypothetical protein
MPKLIVLKNNFKIYIEINIKTAPTCFSANFNNIKMHDMCVKKKWDRTVSGYKYKTILNSNKEWEITYC